MKDTDPILNSLDGLVQASHEGIRRENDTLRRLLKITLEISSLELQDTLDSILTHMMDITQASRGFLFLKDMSDELKIVVTRPISEATSDHGASFSQSVIDEVTRSSRSVMIEDISEDSTRRERESIAGLGLTAVLCVPLKIQSKVQGVFYLHTDQSRHHFSRQEIELFEALAAQAAICIENSRLYQGMRQENRLLKKEILEMKPFQEIIGQSRAMQGVFRTMSCALDNDMTVLIHGETGTGKELVARAIHGNSPRKSRPFVAINCAAMPENLLESELFGHKRGAFTGASDNKIGLFEAATGGTLFLDEIGDTSPAFQVRMLRVLETSTVRRVGETDDRKVDVRVIAASNRDLLIETKKGKFREDLYYRLAVLPITVPPLRERREDIPVLANHFISELNQTLKRRVHRISPDLLEWLIQRNWEGNVRELRNFIQRMMAFARSEELTMYDLPSENVPILTRSIPGKSTEERPIISLESYEQELTTMEKDYIDYVIRQCGGNKAEAARQLGLKKTTLYMKMKALGMGDGVE